MKKFLELPKVFFFVILWSGSSAQTHFPTVIEGYGSAWPWTQLHTCYFPGGFPTALFQMQLYDTTELGGLLGMYNDSILEAPVDSDIVYDYPLPFCESWDTGSFAYNDWTLNPTTGNNWSINPLVGNPSPTADFSWTPVISDYTHSFESKVLDATPFDCGELWLDFDWKLVDQNSTGNELLVVELYRDTTWREVITFANEGSVDWTSEHLNISDGGGKAIKIRFTATGVSSEDIQHWYVDNICLNGICSPPLNLEDYNLWYLGNGFWDVSLRWSPPNCPGPPEQWIHWDDGVNYETIGSGGNWDVDIAARWDANMIAPFEGGSVTKIAFFPTSAGTATYKLRVWKGPDAAILLVDQTVPSVSLDHWNIVNIINPVLIDVTQELWIGLNVNATDGWPAGCDNGPAIVNYGDMIYYSGAWSSIYTAYGLNFNWNIQGYVETAKDAVSVPIVLPPSKPIGFYGGLITASGTTNQNATPFAPTIDPGDSIILGYNLYHGTDFGTIWSQVNTDLILDTSYTDQVFVPFIDEIYYYTTAVFDACESISSNTRVVSIYYGPSIDEHSTGSLLLYPNPATDFIVVKSTSPITSLEVRNFLGQTVYCHPDLNTESIEINVENLPSGIYFVSVTTRQGIQMRKIVVSH